MARSAMALTGFQRRIMQTGGIELEYSIMSDRPRTLFDKIIGRWHAPTPKAHRFVSGLGAPPDRWAGVFASATTFLAAKAFGRYRPGLPWLPYGAIRYLDTVVRPGVRVLEVGAGQSTVFFARRGAVVDSVEGNAGWRNEVLKLTAGQPVRLLDVMPGDVAGIYDLALLDDEPREAVFDRMLTAVRKGGVLMVDNWDWPRFDEIRRQHRPARVFTDFAPYNFSVSTTAIFEQS